MKKVGSAQGAFSDFRSGAEFNGKKSLKNGFPYTGIASISEKDNSATSKLAAMLWKDGLL